MIALILTTVLIAQTYDGKVSVVDGLTDHACEEAKCVATRGMPCAIAQAFDKDRAERDAVQRETWALAHPKQVAACEARQKGKPWQYDCKNSGEMSSGGWTEVSPSDVKTAQCVK